MGEHAVVYGHPAFLAAIDKRLTVKIKSAENGHTIRTFAGEKYIRHILTLVTQDLKMGTLPPMHMSVSSEFPAGYHLGSSAALAAGVIGAVMYFVKRVWNPIRINELAFEAEKFAHGTPSGADNTTVVFGGFVWFRRELPFLKSIWQLPIKLPSSLNNFYLIDTGKPVESTKEMVKFVKSKMKKENSKMQKLMQKNEEQVRRVATAVKEGNEKDLIDAIRQGEQTLEDIGVVSDRVRPCLGAIERSGGAAKILGGGGRKGSVGYLLAYHADGKKLATLVKTYGYTMDKVSLGEEGIRLEERS
jgi:mevalonate kinase